MRVLQRTKATIDKFYALLKESNYSVEHEYVTGSDDSVTYNVLPYVLLTSSLLLVPAIKPKKADVTSSILSKIPALSKKGDKIRYRKFSWGYASGATHKNPMNIRPHYNSVSNTYDKTYWQGQQDVYKTKSGYFAEFVDPYYSIRAAALSIENYKINKKALLDKYDNGKLTIWSFVNIYAPSTENDVQNYVNSLVRQTGISAHEEITLTNKEQFVKIIKAIALMETGAFLSDEYLEDVWNAIFNKGAVPLQVEDVKTVQTAQYVSVPDLGVNNIQ